jgi:hypothetical protein
VTDPATIRQCQHIKDNGEQCRKNALLGKPYCNMASHRRAALWRTQIAKFVQRWYRVAAAAFTLIVAVPTLYGYLTRISVDPYNTVRSHEPMGTVFNLKNNGVFDLHNVTQSCNIVNLSSGGINLLKNTQIIPGNSLMGDLPAGDTKSLSCDQSVYGGHGEADIDIVITYTTRLQRSPRTKHFSLQSVQADDGTWVWKK